VSVPRGEKVAGFVPRAVGAEELRGAGEGRRLSRLFVSEEDAAAFAKPGAPASRADTCLIDVGDANGLKAAQDWPPVGMAFLMNQFEVAPTHGGRGSKGGQAGDVHAIRSERFVSGPAGSAALEITDAWFDVRTLGTRAIERSTLPLTRIFAGPNGLEVYAARDGDAVQVVLHSGPRVPNDDALDEALRGQIGDMVVALPDQNSGSSNCGHVRVALRSPAGTAQMVTLSSLAFLPPSDGDWGQAPEGEDRNSRGLRLLRQMRQRPFRLSVSASSATADPSPIVSAAVGWIGPERPSQI
jgi:hypothetical protein